MRTKEAIRSFAHILNIDLIGFTDAMPLQAGLDRFQSWLTSDVAGEMHWLKRQPEARFNPASLLDGARTVICIGVSYYTGRTPIPAIARYAYGRDYHLVLADKLMQILTFLRQADPGLKAKICVDTSPIAEKPLAHRAGLGWQGRNTLLINDCYGSWLCLGELIINRAYEPDQPAEGRCGSCRACQEACPTGAILADGNLDTGRCLSYASSYDGQAPYEMRGKILGCDICQEVCPFNRHPLTSRERAFLEPNPITACTLEELSTLRQAAYDALRKDTVFSHISYAKFQRNLVRADIVQPRT